IFQQYERIFELAMGIFVPLILLMAFEWQTKTDDAGWASIHRYKEHRGTEEAAVASDYPIKLCAISVMIVGVAMLILSFFQTEHTWFVFGFGTVLMSLGAVLYMYYQRRLKKQLDRVLTNK